MKDHADPHDDRGLGLDCGKLAPGVEWHGGNKGRARHAADALVSGRRACRD